MYAALCLQKLCPLLFCRSFLPFSSTFPHISFDPPKGSPHYTRTKARGVRPKTGSDISFRPTGPSQRARAFLEALLPHANPSYLPLHLKVLQRTPGISTMAENPYPLYPTAVVLPILAFPSWILDIPPVFWHFSQGNVAAGSFILWLILANFFNSINPLIWPRDNVLDWPNGSVYCDIHARLQVGFSVAFAACAAMIARKLAKVMDTRNITVTSSKASRIREKVLEVGVCWGYPALMMITYYIVQPARYFIFGISGCGPIYNASWVTLVISWIWAPITACAAAFFAGKPQVHPFSCPWLTLLLGLLIYRLYRYRREFHHLIAARNTTKSRFMRLFLVSVIVIVIYLPYNFFLIYKSASEIYEVFDWNVVHGPKWNTAIKVPANGVVRFDKWAQVASGYLVFIIFGTGTDAQNTYKRMLCILGLGKIFPSLYVMRESGISTPSSVTFAKGWATTFSSKAKSLFSKNGSVTETLPSSTRNSSVLLHTPTTADSIGLHPVSTTDPILQQHNTTTPTNNGSFFTRIFGRRTRQPLALPVFGKGSVDEEKSPADSVAPGVHARAWASDVVVGEASGSNSVHIFREVHQDRHDSKGKDKQRESDAWV